MAKLTKFWEHIALAQSSSGRIAIHTPSVKSAIYDRLVTTNKKLLNL